MAKKFTLKKGDRTWETDDATERTNMVARGWVQVPADTKPKAEKK